MIQFAIDQNSLEQVQQQLAGFAPRLIPRLREALIPLLQNTLQASAPKYFSGTAPKRGPGGSVLTSRSGKLLSSVLQSLKVRLDSPTSFNISIGSDLSYARIQELGGYAGRRGPFKKKDGRRPYLPARPYLRPTLQDLEDALPELLEQAMQKALES